MRKQPFQQKPVSTLRKARAGSTTATHQPVDLSYIAAAFLIIDTELRIIGINEACQEALLRLSNKHVVVGDQFSAVPVVVETTEGRKEQLAHLCQRALLGEVFFVTGHCIGAWQTRSMLFKLVPMSDCFGNPLILTIAIQDFPADSAIDLHPINRIKTSEPTQGIAEPESPSATAIPAADLQRTFELAPVGIAHVAPDGHWLRVNQYVCNMLGYTRDELATLTYQDVTYPTDLEGDNALAQELLSGKRNSYILEKRYLHKDGNPVWAYLAVMLIRKENGTPKYFIAVLSDIQWQKNVLATAEESQARLEAVFNSLNEAVFVFNAKGKVIDANSAALRLFGYRDISESSTSFADLENRFETRTLDAQILPIEQWPVCRILRGESVANEELRVLQRASGRRWIASFSGTRTISRNGYSEFAILTVRDVTKRHYAELALRRSEHRFRTALDHIPDAVVLYDRSFHVRYVNQAMTELLQRPASAVIGCHESELKSHPLADLRRPLLHAAAADANLQSADFEYASPHGTRYVDVCFVPLMNDRDGVDEIMGIYHDYTERKHAEEKARQAALHDPLTRLPNRALLFEYAKHILGAARRLQEKVAVFFIDLDGFKPINDLHGHETGDEMLRQIAQRLNKATREDDMTFRLGGDEFLILLPRITNVGVVQDMVQHVLEAINRPCEVGNLSLVVSASIGISVCPDDGTEIDMLIQHADAAMYYVKERGRNGYEFYVSEMSAHVEKQAVIEQELKRAIKHNEFCLFFQPVVGMHTGKVVCVEALIRWPGNSASADRFVPIAEATGLIGPVGDWVLSQACEQYRDWKESGLADIPIAINVSPVQFRRHDLAEQIEVTLQRYELSSSAIQVELTETAVMDDLDRAVSVLGRLKRIGIKVSLDDFGTGYSSLNYLSRLPLNKLKIDQTFVQRIESDSAGRAITEAIIVLGRTLGLTVVAEGIESQSIFSYLRERGCDEGQGYFVCKPLSGHELAIWMQTNALK
jgi:diguanylate cyclase (GGDEF)-like protein/PAS domain S-box-containing protein